MPRCWCGLRKQRRKRTRKASHGRRRRTAVRRAAEHGKVAIARRIALARLRRLVKCRVRYAQCALRIRAVVHVSRRHAVGSLQRAQRERSGGARVTRATRAKNRRTRDRRGVASLIVPCDRTRRSRTLSRPIDRPDRRSASRCRLSRTCSAASRPTRRTSHSHRTCFPTVHTRIRLNSRTPRQIKCAKTRSKHTPRGR